MMSSPALFISNIFIDEPIEQTGDNNKNAGNWDQHDSNDASAPTLGGISVVNFVNSYDSYGSLGILTSKADNPWASNRHYYSVMDSSWSVDNWNDSPRSVVLTYSFN